MNNLKPGSESPQIREQEFPLSTPIQLRTTDIDMYMHVNNTRYLDFFDLGKAEYFREATQNRWRLENLFTVIANINISFIKSVHYTNHVKVLTRCEKIGNKSFTLHQMLVDSDNGTVFADCHTIMVCVEKESGESVPVPDSWRNAFTSFENKI